MKKNSHIQIRIELNKKKQLQQILESEGDDISAWLNRLITKKILKEK